MTRHANTKVSATRWAAYAAAGTAATISGQTAEAGITVTDYNVQLMDANPGDGYFDLLSHSFGGGDALTFQFAYSESSSSMGVLTVVGTGVNIAGFAASGFYYPSNLAYGASIAAQSFGLPAGERGDMAWAFGYSNSEFLDQGGYIGLQFDLGSGTQYGWAHLQLDEGVPSNLYTLTQIAWADAGESIFAGQTVPAPGALAFLAFGAAGVRGWRRKRSA